jgi:hypothetical protein
MPQTTGMKIREHPAASATNASRTNARLGPTWCCSVLVSERAFDFAVTIDLR